MLRRSHVIGASLVALLCTIWGETDAQAQETPDIALNQYEQPMAGDTFFSVPSPNVGGHLVPRGLITFDYAKDPLVLVDPNGDDLATPVTSQVYLHFGASFALWSRLMISLDFPLAVAQGGEDSAIGGVALTGADGAEPGDLRIGLRGRIFGEYWDPFQLGVGAYLYTPTGGSDSYTGDGSVYGQPHVLLGGRIPYFVYTAKIGTVLRGSDNPHNLTYGVGLAASLLEDTLQIGPEIIGAVDLQDADLLENQIERVGTVNAELHLGAQYRILDMFPVGVAGGPGIADGVGTPQFRILARVGYDPRPAKEEPPPPDSDRDGIPDAQDACPNTPGVKSTDPTKNGCPPDSDGDGILDQDDACPQTPGVPNEDPTKHGCPPPGDRDGDGIIDDLDACPDTPGVASQDPAKNGCPPDTDGDGIIDPEDACPTEPGRKHADPKKNGCPQVVITDKEVRILQKIEFDFNKATIKPVSNDLLDEIADTLKAHPELTEIEVQGHTDDKGPAFYNKRLSQQRADAVVAALVQRGIDKGRLTAKGYGEEKPIADNKTDAGRAKNRRVQFQIVKRDDSLKKSKNASVQAPKP